MTYNYFINYVKDAMEIKNEEKFILEMGFPPEVNLDPEDYLKVLHIIFVTANGTFRELVDGKNLSALSRYYMIPNRTLQNWSEGKRTPPDYVKYMLAFAMISDICKNYE